MKDGKDSPAGAVFLNSGKRLTCNACNLANDAFRIKIGVVENGAAGRIDHTGEPSFATGHLGGNVGVKIVGDRIGRPIFEGGEIFGNEAVQGIVFIGYGYLTGIGFLFQIGGRVVGKASRSGIGRINRNLSSHIIILVGGGSVFRIDHAN